jgi:hypothetical protein
MRISKVTALIGAVGIGAAVYFLYGRGKGPARRAALRNNLSSLVHWIPGLTVGPVSIPRAESAYLPKSAAQHKRVWNAPMRTVGTFAGAGLALYGMRRRGAIGWVTSGLGSAMLRKNMPWRRFPEPPAS